MHSQANLHSKVTKKSIAQIISSPKSLESILKEQFQLHKTIYYCFLSPIQIFLQYFSASVRLYFFMTTIYQEKTMPSLMDKQVARLKTKF
ncbi:unnamed protein product [Paramecium octaurelia]|uniref:Uncharacterized protein n=1 Tax=Paramecium octaurelia TaxID=43137 RepID=A0A8S1WTD3_PAROT|nr:unnamed protein product [Paramecium octaurelia]